MTYKLTYADRALLLQTFDTLKAASNEDDEKIIRDVTVWAKRLSPRFGFELALTRDITVLSRYLTTNKKDQDVLDVARGALLFVLQPCRPKAAGIDDLDLLDDAFICSYAVHEIRNRLGDRAIYNPPRLTRAEQEQAENLFLEGLESPNLDETALTRKSRELVADLLNLSACGLFQRLHRNVEFLVSVLADQDKSYEQRGYARAALQYLVREDDAIDDRLGILGYLDDNFIVQLAVDFIEPEREPWLEFLDEIMGVLPFLNGLIISEDGTGRPLSEYMMINAALTCPELRGDDSSSSTMLVAPLTGPVPFLLGFISLAGFLQRGRQQKVTEESFRPGQKVLVDGSAVAEFSGIKYFNERKMFGLTQQHVQHGYSTPCTHYWPISELDRLLPADSSRVTRGQLMYDLSRTDIPLPALLYLFNSDQAVQFSSMRKRVLVVMPVANAHDMAGQLNLYGHPMKDIMPMGHLSADGEVKPWSTRFGEQEPLLVFVSDLDVACSFLEGDSDYDHLVIVDATGRNAGKKASMQRLRQLKIPSLIVTTERSAESPGQTGDLDIDVWNWGSDDFSTLVWPAQGVAAPSGPIGRYERRLQSCASSSPEVRCIPSPLADKAFESVRKVEALSRMRGEDRLEELDDIVTHAFRVMSLLLRCACPLTERTFAARRVEEGLEKLTEIRQESRFLSGEEKQAASEAEDSLRAFFAELRHENPKSRVVRELLIAGPDLALVCPDARLRPDLDGAYREKGTRVLATCDEGEELQGAIVPGWFRGDRMAMLLVPPVTNPLHLVLYEIEREWYRDSLRQRQRIRDARLSRTDRSRLFPKVRGWRKARPGIPPVAPVHGHGSKLQELEAIHEHFRTVYRQEVYKAARSDGRETELPASLVVFEGNFYGFLTDSYKANVVTHLLDASVGDPDDESDVKQKPIAQLGIGDALLFHRGSGSDVIRVAADRILPPGKRETSSLWRAALLDYAAREKLETEDIWERLRTAGCPLTHHTIKTWLDDEGMIAPQAYHRDVQAIAEVTQDKTLADRMNDVLAAIREVRGAHLRASSQLAKQVLAGALNILREEGKQSSLVELESNIVVVRILEIDDRPSMVRASMVNRLLEGEQWHE